jgi:nitroimidazol reductase NimA-like FMN-containing flavoprotein (pyridoxamine 5'-phosphate oxidase superfamily)
LHFTIVNSSLPTSPRHKEILWHQLLKSNRVFRVAFSRCGRARVIPFYCVVFIL